VFDAEQVHDLQVFSGLGHGTVIGRNDQHPEIDPTDPGNHVVNETAMPGHVDKTHNGLIVRPPIGIAQVDGKSAVPFLFQTIRFHAREILDQRGFAVVDVTCGSDNQFGRDSSWETKPASSSRQRREQ